MGTKKMLMEGKNACQIYSLHSTESAKFFLGKFFKILYPGHSENNMFGTAGKSRIVAFHQ